MWKRFVSGVAVAIVIVLVPLSAHAIPDLQLFIGDYDPVLGGTITDGSYDTTTGTWVTSMDSFDLWAFSSESTPDAIVSVALSPDLFYVRDSNGNIITDPGKDDVGGTTVYFEPGTTITINGVTLTESDFVFGYAPFANDPESWDNSGDLPTHGVFPTAYAEIDADIINAGKIFNTQPTNGVLSTSLTDGYYFQLAISDAVEGIHFDLYTIDANGELLAKAPFSKDAETGPPPVPEPATLLLLGGGLASLAIMRKRISA